jgi:hypothetical protein
VPSHETLGLLLVREGLITRPELYDALRLQRQTGHLLGTCLLSLGYIRPEILLGMLARQLAVPALPPGALDNASPEALRRVPWQVALKLRVLPYSWDGQMLGVAVADGNALNSLQEVAYYSRSAVGAYLALESEIDVALGKCYPGSMRLAVTAPAAATTPAIASVAAVAPARPPVAAERSRPPTLGAAATVSAQDLGPAVLRNAKKPSPAPRPAPGPNAGNAAPSVPVISAAPPPAAAKDDLERVGFFDAVEKIYDTKGADDLGRWVGRALLNYFTNVLIVVHDPPRLRVVGSAGLSIHRIEPPDSALPLVVSRLDERRPFYGLASSDVRAAELAGVFGFEPGATALIVSVGAAPARFIIYADNGGSTDLYEDMHDIELLFKEAETGLGMLLEKR